MNLGDWLFRLTARDQQQAQIEFVREKTGQIALLSATVSITFEVPISKIFMLTFYRGVATAGAAQNVISTQLQYYPNRLQPDPSDIAFEFDFVAPISRGNFWWPEGLLIPPGNTIRYIAGFSAAVNPNNVELQLNGLFIPRGEVGFSSLIP